MIEGEKTEREYRETKFDSSSSLKDFALDRKKYYRKFILGESVKDKDSKAAIVGRVVETLLLEPDDFDNKFHMSACISEPTGLMLAFVEALYSLTVEATDESGEVMSSFEDLSREAHIISGYKISYERVIKQFVGSDAEIFYNEIRIVRPNNLTVVTAQDVTNAESVVETLRTSPITGDILGLINSDRYSVIIQCKVEGYELYGHKLKSMMDFVIIDHVKETIQVYDLKCVWAVEDFYKEYYLYRRAYIQARLYWEAAKQLATDKLANYEVLYPKFMVCDSIGYYQPLIYTLSYEDIRDAEDGFQVRGYSYPGVKEIISNLKWAVDTNLWDISKKNYLKNGVVNIKG